jgi:hypothetical protein
MRGAGLLCLLCVCAASPAALGPGLGAGARLSARTATGRAPPLPEGETKTPERWVDSSLGFLVGIILRTNLL